MPAKKTSTKRAAAKKPAAPRSMSDEHKAALASGRLAGRAVRNYLEALETHKPKRGRKRTPESIGKRLEAIDSEMITSDPVKRLSLTQEQLDLQAELSTLNVTADLSALEDAFVQHAKTYGDSKGISYVAWRSIGVAPHVLKAAGITRAN